MARLLVYYAHPGQKFSRVNALMADRARRTEGLTFVDLYADYPRHRIDVDAEQARLAEAEVILFQFPLFWYSTPSIVKEWQDLVLEHGWAYGHGGTALAGKRMMLAVSCAGPEDAYSTGGYQHFPLRTFLAPLEQTARLCRMSFPAPYVLYGALKAAARGEVAPHVEGYATLLSAIRDDRYDWPAAEERQTVHHDSLPLIRAEAGA